MQKNEEVEGVVEGLGSDGEGIVKVQGTTAFVPFCLAGEKVRFKVLKVKGNIAYGKLLKVLTPSYKRVNPPCPVFGKCGGCDLQHMSYEGQLEFKRDSVSNSLKKIGGIYARVNDAVPCEKPFNYRNKLVLPVGEDAAGNIEVGFFARRSHRVVPIDRCPIQAEWTKKAIGALREFAPKQGKHIRHFVAREIGGKYIFVLVADREIAVDPMICAIQREFEEFTFYLNINNSTGNAIFGDRWKLVFGNGFFDGEECGITYRAGANTFLQVNDDIRAKLYDSVLKEISAGAVAIDLYSGGGLLTAMLAKKCGLAYGIEVVEEASHCADELKKQNNLDGKMHNICGKVEEKLQEVFKATEGKKRVIVCDPPRKGMAREVVNAIYSSAADKIILISCNPATLARDLGILLGTLKDEGGLVKCEGVSEYELKYVTPFDMFPQTKWCETLVVLERKNAAFRGIWSGQ